MSKKVAVVGIRLTAEERDALERACRDDRRLPSVLSRFVLTDWLREQGWLKESGPVLPETAP